jgi:hypothetical protein
MNRASMFLAIFAVLGFNGVLLFFCGLLGVIPSDDSPWPFIFRFTSTSTWIIQFLYLIPIVRYYRHKKHWETVKGISIGAILTILLNSACYGPAPAGMKNLPIFGALGLTIVVMLITFYAFNRRSRPK